MRRGLAGGPYNCFNAGAGEQPNQAIPQCPNLVPCAATDADCAASPGTIDNWLAGINAKLAAAGLSLCPPTVNGCQTSLAQLFEQAGLGQSDQTCYLALTPCTDPYVVDYMAANGIPIDIGGAMTATPPGQSAYGTNYEPLQPNATTATSATVAPSTLPAATQITTSTPGASIAPAQNAAPAAVAAGCSFALFGDTSCIGPVGTTTALVLGGAALLLFILMGAKH